MQRMKEEKDCSCYGYDLSSVAIDEIRKRGLEGEVADFRKPKPNGRMFDCVVASHVLEHMQDDSAFLKTLASLLKSEDGKVIVSVPMENIALVADLEHQRVYDEESLEQTMRSVFNDVTIKAVPRETKGRIPLLVAIGSKPHGI